MLLFYLSCIYLYDSLTWFARPGLSSSVDVVVSQFIDRPILLLIAPKCVSPSRSITSASLKDSTLLTLDCGFDGPEDYSTSCTAFCGRERTYSIGPFQCATTWRRPNAQTTTTTWSVLLHLHCLYSVFRTCLHSFTYSWLPWSVRTINIWVCMQGQTRDPWISLHRSGVSSFISCSTSERYHPPRPCVFCAWPHFGRIADRTLN